MARLRTEFHAGRCPATGSVITCNLNGITGNLHAQVLSLADNRRYPASVGPPSMFLRSSVATIRRGEEMGEWDKEKRTLCTCIAVFLLAVDDRESSIIGGIKRKAIIGRDAVMSR